jgi:hypothetical protein
MTGVEPTGRWPTLAARAARDTYLDALVAAHFAGRLAHGTDLCEAAEHARRAPRPGLPPRASDLLLDGLATALSDGYTAGAPVLQQAMRAFRGPSVTVSDRLRWLWPAAHIAMALWDDESYEVLSARHIEVGRESGLLAVLPTALTTRIVASTFAGEFIAAERLITEMRVLTDAMDVAMPSYGPLFLSSWRGNETALAEVSRVAVEENTARGEGAGLAFADYAHAVLQRPRTLRGGARGSDLGRRLCDRGLRHLHGRARGVDRGGGSQRCAASGG